jgi:hypothetical protein
MYGIWYLSHGYCYLPLSWKSWNWFEYAVGGIRFMRADFLRVDITAWVCGLLLILLVFVGVAPLLDLFDYKKEEE